MTFNAFMHPRNLYKYNRPNFAELAQKDPEFKKYCRVDLNGTLTLDFQDPQAVRALTLTLLKKDFDLQVDFPPDSLVPRLPLRLNYILWLEDIIKENFSANSGDQIFGIDVGTGYSCIYPILGHKLCGWNFLALDKEEDAVAFAWKNVEVNHMQDSIRAVKVDDECSFYDVVSSSDIPFFHFSMCNPPFYSSATETTAISRERRPKPHSATIAKPVEVYAEGGEIVFIGKMIDDSFKLQKKVRVYTSMVGKKTSLVPIKNKLKELNVCQMCETTFCQGKTQRWAVAWSFDPSISLNIESLNRPSTSKRLFKMRIPQEPMFSGLELDFQVVISRVIELLENLKMQFHESKKRRLKPPAYAEFCVETTVNTWTHQRRKRRAAERLGEETVPKRDNQDSHHDTQKASSSGDVCSGQQLANILTSEDQCLPRDTKEIDHREDERKDSGDASTKEQLLKVTATDNGFQDRQTTAIATGSSSSSKFGFYLKFRLAVKGWKTASDLEFQFIDGSSVDSLHQVMQYFKNNFLRRQ